ncbi:ribonuclease E/G [Skermanella pratensis]|uniref:ribonuclease E/G n=1 Tax=Skermanella pratensis TaxID=2233999 RepID=UPI00130163DA|nr:ribonuclease E/G [Skermanella pratensis]
MTDPSRGIEILIDRSGPLLRAAVVEDGRLTDLHIDTTDRQSRLGEVVLGRVDRIVTALNGAFVDIGGAAGLLNNADLRTAAPASRKAARAGTALRAGQPVLVQVKAEPGGGKGPSLTMDVTLPGRFLVMTPFKPGISISRRLAQGDARGRLSQMISEITGGLGGGWIVRGSALGVEPGTLAAEAESLAVAWRGIERQTTATPPVTLRPGPTATVRAVIENGGRPIAGITVADPSLRDELAACAPDLAPLIRIESGALFDRYDLEGEFLRLTEREVPLPGGGSLVIDRTEALTVIDVNGGERPNALATNLDAVTEIARQLRLRNVGGIVIVDFINMASRADAERVLDGLTRATADDPAGVNVYGMSKLGLVELTRSRRGPPLADLTGR